MPIQTNRHPSLLRPQDALLLVIDMQEPFLRGALGREQLLRNVTLLADAAAILQVPVVSTLQNRARMGDAVPEVSARLPAQRAPLDKMCFSCTEDETIVSEVSAAARNQIILCGVETHICVSQTAHDLIALGFQTHVVADAVSSRKRSDWEIGLRRMERAGAIVTSTESVIYELLGKAGTPEFRALLPLVK